MLFIFIILLDCHAIPHRPEDISPEFRKTIEKIAMHEEQLRARIKKLTQEITMEDLTVKNFETRAQNHQKLLDQGDDTTTPQIVEKFKKQADRAKNRLEKLKIEKESAEKDLLTSKRTTDRIYPAK